MNRRLRFGTSRPVQTTHCRKRLAGSALEISAAATLATAAARPSTFISRVPHSQGASSAPVSGPGAARPRSRGTIGRAATSTSHTPTRAAPIGAARAGGSLRSPPIVRQPPARVASGRGVAATEFDAAAKSAAVAGGASGVEAAPTRADTNPPENRTGRPRMRGRPVLWCVTGVWPRDCEARRRVVCVIASERQLSCRRPLPGACLP